MIIFRFSRMVCLALLSLMTGSAVLLGAEAKRRFDVPAGDAATTLARFAEQADLEIVFSPSAVKGVQTNAVTGEFDPRDGLDRLVAGTGLVVTRDSSSGALSVRKTQVRVPPPRSDQRSSAQSAAGRTSDEAVMLNPFTVQANFSGGYGESQSITALGVAMSLRDLPQSVSVYNREFLTDIGADNLLEALAYDSSTTRANIPQAGEISFRIRGFDAAILRDGMRASGSGNMANVERVEVMKGAAAVIYGGDSPGGFINYITKAPLPELRVDTTVSLGSHNYKKAELSVTGPLSESKNLLFRFDTSYLDTNGFSRFGESERSFWSGRIEYRPLSGVTASVFHDGQNYNDKPVTQLPIYAATAASDQQQDWVEDIDVDFHIVGPEAFDDTEARTSGYDVQITRFETLSLRHRMTYYRHDRGWHAPLGNDLLRDGRTTATTSEFQVESNIENLQFRTEGLWRKGLSPNWTQSVLLGMQNNDLENRGAQGTPNGILPPLDIRAPDAAFRLKPPADISEQMIVSEANYNEYFAVLHGEWKRPAAHIVGGARYVEKSRSGSEATWVPQIGATLGLGPRFTLWGMYTESFRPIVQADRFGNKLPDETGTTTEFGVRWEPSQRLTAALSLFEGERNNIVRTVQIVDPATGRFVQDRTSSGLERVRGLELESTMTFGRDFTLRGSVMLLDSEIVSNVQQPVFEGLRVLRTPDYQVGLVARYRFSSERHGGFHVGLGGFATGESRSADNPRRLRLMLDAHTVFSLFAGWSGELAGRSLNVRLNVNNVLDERYREVGYVWGSPGPEFRLSVHNHF